MSKYFLLFLIIVFQLYGVKIVKNRSDKEKQSYTILFDKATNKSFSKSYNIITSSNKFNVQTSDSKVKVNYSGRIRGYYTAIVTIKGEFDKGERVKVTIDQIDPIERVEKGVKTDPFFKGYLNYRELKSFKKIYSSKSSNPLFNLDGYKLLVDKDGWYKVDHYDFLRLGYSLDGIDPKKFKLFNEGVEIPIYISGESDGRFDSYDYIEFYGERNLYRYRDENPDRYLDTESEENIYTLVYNDGDGKRLISEDGSLVEEDPFIPSFYRSTLHFEEDNVRNNLRFVPHRIKPDLYFYSLVAGGENIDIPFNLSTVAEQDLFVKYSITPILSSVDYNREYNVLMSINQKNFSTSWIGPDPQVDSVSIKPDYLEDGENIFNIANLNSIDDDILFNWFEVTYSSEFLANSGYILFNEGGKKVAGNYYSPLNQYYQYEINGFEDENISLYKLGVSKLENYQVESYNDESGDLKYKVLFQDFIASNSKFLAIEEGKKLKVKKIIRLKEYDKSLFDRDNRCEYLIVTDSLFMESSALLEYIERKEGSQFGQYGVKLVDVDQVLDEFSSGEWTGEALHQFFKFMVKEWETAPTHVLLIGSSVYNHKKNYENDLVPLKTFQHFRKGAIVSDYIYSTLEEGDTDFEKTAPQFFIGRVPATTENQLENYLNKVDRYEAKDEDGPQFRNRLKDYFILTDSIPYDNLKEIIVENTSKRRYSDRLLLWPNGVPSRYQGGTATLQNKWDQGLGEVNYFGHGSGEIWANSNLLVPEDVGNFLRSDYLPIVYAWTCFSGNFPIDPHQSSDDLGLTTALMFTYKKGGVAVIAPSGNSEFEQNFDIFKEVNNSKQEKPETLGEYFTNSIYRFYLPHISMDDNKGYKNLHQYLILGDPTLRINYADDSTIGDLDKEVVTYGEVVTFNNLPSGLGKIELYNSEDHMVELLQGEGLITPETVVNNSLSITIPAEEECNVISNNGGYLTARIFIDDQNGNYLSDYKTIFLDDGDQGVSFKNSNSTPEPYQLSPNDSLTFKTDIYSKFSIENINCYVDTSSGSFDQILDSYNKDHQTYTMVDKIKVGKRLDKIRYYFKVTTGEGEEYSSEIDSIIVPVGDLSHSYNSIRLSDSLFSTLNSTVKLSNSYPYFGAPLNYDDIIVSYSLKVGDIFEPIGNDTISIQLEKNLLEREVVSQIAAELPKGEVEIKLDINSNRSHLEYYGAEPPYDNNVRTDKIRNYQYLVTKESGSTVNGNHAKGSIGSFTIEIFENSIDGESSVLNMDSLQLNDFNIPDNLTPLYGLGTDYIFKGKITNNEILSKDAAIILEGVEGNLSLLNSYSIYIFNPEIGKWELLDTEYTQISDTSFDISTSSKSLGLFGLFKNSDNTPPIVEMGVEGQNYTDNGFVPSRCNIILTAKDISGVDPQSIKVYVDDQPLQTSEYQILDLNLNESSVKVLFEGNFSNGDHSIRVEAKDYANNSNSVEKLFKVSKDFAIEYHGNYPNPFKNRTVFCFKVSREAEKVSLKIFTVAGRLVKEFKESNVINYSEIIWDGRDNSGNLVANGVYFYKLKVVSGGKSYEKQGKMAKLRR